MIQTFVCKYCGKEFQRNNCPSTSKKCTFEFCSPSCRNKGRIIKIDVIPCPVCGENFVPIWNDVVNGERVRKRFCSSKCGRIAQRGKPSTNPLTHSDDDCNFVRDNFPSNGAAWCAEKLGYSISVIRNLAERVGAKVNQDTLRKIVYDVSKKRMTDNNPMKIPEVAAKVGASVSERYRTDTDYRMKFLAARTPDQRKKASKPELKCKQILDSLNVIYIHQSVIKPGFLVDFQINNTIIQVDGEYWHGHPRFEPLTDRQISQHKRDAAQDKYLRACEYTVIRVWESDITHGHIESILRRASLLSE